MAIRPSSCYICHAPPITEAHVAALEADDFVVIDGLFPNVEELRAALETPPSKRRCSPKPSALTKSDGLLKMRLSWATPSAP